MTFEFLTFVLFLNVLATIALWQISARKPAKLKKKFVAALLHSMPITPKHRPPKTIGEKFASLIAEEDQRFFDDFSEFANVVNWWLGDSYVENSWRLQELPDTILKLNFSDTPCHGRRYSIFHNQVHLGTLEVSPSVRYSVEEPEVHTDIELDWVRLLLLGEIREFLDGIALHVSHANPNTKEHFQTCILIDRALIEVLWQTQQISEFGMDGKSYGQLELRLVGSASWYLVRRQALLQKQSGHGA